MSAAPSEAGKLAPLEFVRLGDDPFGREESTVYYRHPDVGVCYVWLKLLPDDDPLKRAALTPRLPQEPT